MNWFSNVEGEVGCVRVGTRIAGTEVVHAEDRGLSSMKIVAAERHLAVNWVQSCRLELVGLVDRLTDVESRSRHCRDMVVDGEILVYWSWR